MKGDLRRAKAAAQEQGALLQETLAREAHLEQQVTSLTGWGQQHGCLHAL